ncbi:hypothetical protein ACPPVW_02855 [Leifsonia sp. McL0607]|uniref:hypothetical protein n=1 Tax=Leifsonia sp. McL0607 TaxID=3415672 RepID=UPI003CED1C2A
MRKKIFGGLVALALALAPAAGANAVPYPPGPDDSTKHGVLDTYVGAPGDTITYTADTDTYLSEEALTHKIRGTEAHTVNLASTTVKAAPATEGTFSKTAATDGSHTFSFTIPMSAQHGDQYEIDVINAAGEVWDNFVVTTVVTPVGPTDPDSGPSRDLAMTGSDIAITGIATGAVLLFVGGLVLLIVRRRRSRADVAAQ